MSSRAPILPPLRRTAADAERFAPTPYTPPPGKRNDYNPSGLSPSEREAHDAIFRQTDVLREMPLSILRSLWDQYDGGNAPEGWDGEAIHLALNMVGDGAYCAI